MNRRGIAFETLAKIAIVVLILVSVTVFFTVGMQKLAQQFVGSTPQGTGLTNAQAQCRTMCMALNNILADSAYAKTQPYCTTVFKLSEDGNANDNDHCYDSIITVGTPCTVTLSGGGNAVIDLLACQGGDLGQAVIEG